MEISVWPDVFLLQFIEIVCMKINLIRLPKHPFIVAKALQSEVSKIWNFSKNKLYYDLV